jgi:hypothetical protein
LALISARICGLSPVHTRPPRKIIGTEPGTHVVRGRERLQ